MMSSANTLPFSPVLNDSAVALLLPPALESNAFLSLFAGRCSNLRLGCGGSYFFWGGSGGVETLGACWKVVGMKLCGMGMEVEWSSVRGTGLGVMCHSSVELLRYPLSQERYTAREECKK
jgi:hypothetical protein